jgi:16S rRNA (uracil1498-N3)-methyltransferase
MAERFYVNRDLSPGLVELRGPEAHHLGAVCRARPGDAVCLFNGDGHEYLGRVVEVTRRDVTVEVLSREARSRELPFLLHLAAPLPRGDRAWFLVEKLTELGAGALTILSTERSVVQPREAKLEKLQRHVIEASKQCGRNVLMRLDGPRRLEDFLRDGGLPATRLLAHPAGAGSATEWPAARGDRAACVGPEGGFSEAEVARAREAGWRLIDLGPRILRVETAALALAARSGA